MKGDFSRLTFNPRKHYSGVLMQQGRVMLDSDWNEQAGILNNAMRKLVEDLIGRHGGPGDAFAISPRKIKGTFVPRDFNIQEGRYYVRGVMCENDRTISYTDQLGYPFPDSAPLNQEGPYLVYLEVWEREITSIEDSDLSEPALGRPDTSIRSKVVWTVKVMRPGSSCKSVEDLLPISRAALRARVRRENNDGLNIAQSLGSPQSFENRLYRIEIHGGSEHGRRATFKWSRVNGSTMFPITRIDRTDATTILTLGGLNVDMESRVPKGTWVEIIDNEFGLHKCADPLLQVVEHFPGENKIALQGHTKVVAPSNKAPRILVWDQQAAILQRSGTNLSDVDHAALVIEGTVEEEDTWLRIENGLEIQFAKNPAAVPDGSYRTGDYWLIPTRTNPNVDIEWPCVSDANGNPLRDGNKRLIPEAVQPHGVVHYYAPLCVISVASNGSVKIKKDCRNSLRPISCGG